MDLPTALRVIDEDGCVQDIGQLTAIRKELDKMVKRGELKKTRAPWLWYMGGLKTTYLKNQENNKTKSNAITKRHKHES